MSTLISRSTWTDDTGTPAAPAGDGTPIDNAELQKIYANVDAMIAAAISFGATVSAEGLGTHLFSAGDAGSNVIRVRNTSAGATNLGGVEIGNDADADLGRLWALASSYTATGALKQNGVALRAMGAGGLSLAAEHASGDLRGYARGTSKLWTFDGETLEFAGGNRGACHAPMTIDGSVDYTDAGNAADTNYAVLYSDTIPVDTLDEDGRTLRYDFAIDGSTSNSKDLQLFLGGSGGTKIYELLNNTSVLVINITVFITRTGSNAQRVVVFTNSPGSASAQVTDATETDSGTLELLVQGRSDASAANDYVGKFGVGAVVR